MQINIFTEDSKVKFPEIKDDCSLGRGTKVKEIPNFLNKLKNKNLEIPSTDLEKEEQYKEVLSDFIRPAELMFFGLYKEVIHFYYDLDRITEIDLYIISGRYGLIHSDEKIIPYDAYIENHGDLKELDGRTDFSTKMVEKANKSDLNLFFLTKRYLDYLISEQIFRKINSDIIMVTSQSIKNKLGKYDNIKIFDKKGIARICWQNRKKIKNIIKEKNSSLRKY